jgi:alkanesulfonate monooxygenase SsuD/methylene tetrahydromethanopterin reductase-like flavin-dependent oxidoreductase (luciferase family)
MNTTTASIHPWVAEGAHRTRFGINTTVLPDWPATRDFVQTAEGLGFDALLLPHHPVTTPSASWTSLAALAGVTRTIRLGTLVSCVYYLNPVMLARMAADVDRLSDGRVVLGLGSGDQPQEFRQLGLTYPPAPERQAALEEGLRIIKPLLRGEPVTYQGVHFHAEGAVLQPPPVQQPYVPLLVAGGGERTTLRLAAQYADASNLGAASWAGRVFTPTDAQPKFETLRRHCEAAGRPYEALLRTALVGLFLADTPAALQAKMEQVPPPLLGFFEQLPIVGTPEEAVGRVRALVAAGFQYVFCIILPFDLETLRLTAERVLPAVVEA